MQQKGFVYILTNPSMPNKLKVGKSIKVPTERAKELETTGVPTPFEVQYYAFFDDMDEAEKRAHNRLSAFHHGKEFFDIDVPTAIHAIEGTGISFQKLFSKPEDDEKAEELKKKHEFEQRHRERIKKEEQQRREANEMNAISKLIKENTQKLIKSIFLVLVGMAAIYLSANYYEKDSGGHFTFFWVGAIIIFINGMKSYQRFKDLMTCLNKKKLIIREN
jgi:hypothetical protein